MSKGGPIGAGRCGGTVKHATCKRCNNGMWFANFTPDIFPFCSLRPLFHICKRTFHDLGSPGARRGHWKGLPAMSRGGTLGLAGAEARGDMQVLLLLKLSEWRRRVMLGMPAAAKLELLLCAGCLKPATMPPWLDRGISLQPDFQNDV